VLARVLVLLAVLVLSACTSRVGGVPIAATTLPDEPAELTAEAAFDDLRTVDPCSLTALDVFESFGSAEFGTPESLDYCSVKVTPTAGGEALVSIGEFGLLEAVPELQGKRVKDVDRGLWIGQQDDTPSFCSQMLVFPDGVTMQVLGSVFEGDMDTCPMVEAAMEHVTSVVLDGGIEHRKPERDSLLLLDPCSLIDDDAVAAIPGLATVRASDKYPAKHVCFWKASGGTVTLRLQFVAGPKPGAYGRAGANENPVAGRPSATNPYPDVGEATYCSVETAAIPFTEVKGGDYFEIASVFVRMPKGQIDAGCAAANAVALAVWPKLPAA
jgi:hypothetical protein